MSTAVDGRRGLLSTAVLGAVLVVLSLVLSQPHRASSRDDSYIHVERYSSRYGTRLGHGAEAFAKQLKRSLASAGIHTGGKQMLRNLAGTLLRM